jgi:hypothetical protein
MVFYRVGARMHLQGLPRTYFDWKMIRREHLQQNLINSQFTGHLYSQYKKHLGGLRYGILKQVQVQLVPPQVSKLLGLKNKYWLFPMLSLYRFFRRIKMERVFTNALLPKAFAAQIRGMDDINPQG